MFDLKSFCEVNGIEMIRNDDFGYTVFRKKKRDVENRVFGIVNEEIDSNPKLVSLRLIKYFELL